MDRTAKQLEQLLHDKDLSALNRFPRPTASGEPNIFKIIAAENRELHHSNFLAFLFDPKNNHPFGTSFFESFCRASRLTLRLECKLDVRREYKNIDLLIADETNRIVVVVENKVYAQESNDQLRRYRKLIESEKSYRGWRKKYFFLSMTGEKPEGDSAWRAIGYDLLADILGELSRKKKTSNALGLVIRNYREITSGALMTEKADRLCKKIVEKHQQAVESVMQFSSTKIEGPLIKALVEGADKRGFKILKKINRTADNSYHITFAPDGFPRGLFFQFYIYGGRGIWLVLVSWANKNQKLVANFSSFSRRFPSIFNKIKRSGPWHCFFEKQFFDNESVLSESERVTEIVKNWNDFLANDYVKIDKMIAAFRRARAT